MVRFWFEAEQYAGCPLNRRFVELLFALVAGTRRAETLTASPLEAQGVAFQSGPQGNALHLHPRRMILLLHLFLVLQSMLLILLFCRP